MADAEAEAPPPAEGEGEAAPATSKLAKWRRATKLQVNAMRATGAKAAVAFSFLTWAATCVSMLFTFKEWRDAGYESMPGIPSNFDYMPGRGNAATTQTFA